VRLCSTLVGKQPTVLLLMVNRLIHRWEVLFGDAHLAAMPSLLEAQ
jgi:hypothetical protein